MHTLESWVSTGSNSRKKAVHVQMNDGALLGSSMLSSLGSAVKQD